MNREELEKRVAAAKTGDRIVLYEGLGRIFACNYHGEVRVASRYGNDHPTIYSPDGSVVCTGKFDSYELGDDGVLYVCVEEWLYRVHVGEGLSLAHDQKVYHCSQWFTHPRGVAVLDVSDEKTLGLYIGGERRAFSVPRNEFCWGKRLGGCYFILRNASGDGESLIGETGLQLCRIPDGAVDHQALGEDVYLSTATGFYCGDRFVRPRMDKNVRRPWRPVPGGIAEVDAAGELFVNGRPFPYKGPISDLRQCKHGLIVSMTDPSAAEGRQRIMVMLLVIKDAAPMWIDADAIVCDD